MFLSRKTFNRTIADSCDIMCKKNCSDKRSAQGLKKEMEREKEEEENAKKQTEATKKPKTEIKKK